MILRKAEIEFGVKILCGMNAHLELAGSKVIAHLEYAFFYLWRIAGVDDVLTEIVVIYLLCLVFIGKHQECLVMATEDVVDVDANQQLDF